MRRTRYRGTGRTGADGRSPRAAQSAEADTRSPRRLWWAPFAVLLALYSGALLLVGLPHPFLPDPITPATTNANTPTLRLHWHAFCSARPLPFLGAPTRPERFAAPTTSFPCRFHRHRIRHAGFAAVPGVRALRR